MFIFKELIFIFKINFVFFRIEEVDWDEKKILVMNSVVIEPPYEVSNCLIKKGDSRALEHVKKIVC